MASVPHLRRKNVAAAVGADGITGSSALLPQMQTRKHYQRKQFSNRKRISARHKGAVLTASAMRSCIASFERENHEKSLDAEAGPAGGAQLSFLHGGSDICAAGLSRLQLDGAGRQRPERGQCTFPCAVGSAQRVLQCVRGRLRDRRLHRHPRAENQAAAHRDLSVCRYGMDLRHRLSDVSRRAAMRARFRTSCIWSSPLRSCCCPSCR